MVLDRTVCFLLCVQGIIDHTYHSAYGGVGQVAGVDRTLPSVVSCCVGVVRCTGVLCSILSKVLIYVCFVLVLLYDDVSGEEWGGFDIFVLSSYLSSLPPPAPRG